MNRVLWKKVFLEISQNSQEKTCARVSRLHFLVFGLNTEIYGVNFRIHSKKTKESITSQKLGSQYFWQACNFIKNETLAQVFSCEFCEISKNTFFIEHLWWLLLHFFNCNFIHQILLPTYLPNLYIKKNSNLFTTCVNYGFSVCNYSFAKSRNVT